jgi:hypothetical protein
MMNSRAPTSAPAREPLATPGRRCGVCRQTGHDRRSCPVLRGASQQGASPPAPPTRQIGHGQGVRASASSDGNRVTVHIGSNKPSILDVTVDNRVKRDMQDTMKQFMETWKNFEREERDLTVDPQQTRYGRKIIREAHLVTDALSKLKEQFKKRKDAIRSLETAINELEKSNINGITAHLYRDYSKQIDVFNSCQTVYDISKLTFEYTYLRWNTVMDEWTNRQKYSLKDILLSMSQQTERADVCIPADDCPICMEPLGNTGKTVLSCGHTLCTSCFIKQIVVAHDQKKSENCGCPICRRKYAGGSAPRTPQQTEWGSGDVIP